MTTNQKQIIDALFEIKNPSDNYRTEYKTIKKTKVNPFNKDELIIVFNNDSYVDNYLVKKDDYKKLLANKFFDEFPRIPMYQYEESSDEKKENWYNIFYGGHRQENWKIIKGKLSDNPLRL